VDAERFAALYAVSSSACAGCPLRVR